MKASTHCDREMDAVIKRTSMSFHPLNLQWRAIAHVARTGQAAGAASISSVPAILARRLAARVFRWSPDLRRTLAGLYRRHRASRARHVDIVSASGAVG